MHTEGYITLITLVRFPSSMNFPVINKVWVLTKDFATFITLHLQYKRFARCESWLNTLAHTFIWLFSSMDHLMCSEVWALSKGFATLITLERYHSNMFPNSWYMGKYPFTYINLYIYSTGCIFLYLVRVLI